MSIIIVNTKAHFDQTPKLMSDQQKWQRTNLTPRVNPRLRHMLDDTSFPWYNLLRLLTYFSVLQIIKRANFAPGSLVPPSVLSLHDFFPIKHAFVRWIVECLAAAAEP
jgi:hypothetical protein